MGPKFAYYTVMKRFLSIIGPRLVCVLVTFVSFAHLAKADDSKKTLFYQALSIYHMMVSNEHDKHLPVDLIDTYGTKTQSSNKPLTYFSYFSPKQFKELNITEEIKLNNIDYYSNCINYAKRSDSEFLVNLSHNKTQGFWQALAETTFGLNIVKELATKKWHIHSKTKMFGERIYASFEASQFTVNKQGDKWHATILAHTRTGRHYSLQVYTYQNPFTHNRTLPNETFTVPLETNTTVSESLELNFDPASNRWTLPHNSFLHHKVKANSIVIGHNSDKSRHIIKFVIDGKSPFERTQTIEINNIYYDQINGQFRAITEPIKYETTLFEVMEQDYLTLRNLYKAIHSQNISHDLSLILFQFTHTYGFNISEIFDEQNIELRLEPGQQGALLGLLYNQTKYIQFEINDSFRPSLKETDREPLQFYLKYMLDELKKPHTLADAYALSLDSNKQENALEYLKDKDLILKAIAEIQQRFDIHPEIISTDEQKVLKSYNDLLPDLNIIDILRPSMLSFSRMSHIEKLDSSIIFLQTFKKVVEVLFYRASGIRQKLKLLPETITTNEKMFLKSFDRIQSELKVRLKNIGNSTPLKKSLIRLFEFHSKTVEPQLKPIIPFVQGRIMQRLDALMAYSPELTDWKKRSELLGNKLAIQFMKNEVDLNENVLPLIRGLWSMYPFAPEGAQKKMFQDLSNMIQLNKHPFMFTPGLSYLETQINWGVHSPFFKAVNKFIPMQKKRFFYKLSKAFELKEILFNKIHFEEIDNSLMMYLDYINPVTHSKSVLGVRLDRNSTISSILELLQSQYGTRLDPKLNMLIKECTQL